VLEVTVDHEQREMDEGEICPPALVLAKVQSFGDLVQQIAKPR
jgi:hypothetical protein